MAGLLVDCVWYCKMNKPWSSDVIYKHEQVVGRIQPAVEDAFMISTCTTHPFFHITGTVSHPFEQYDLTVCVIFPVYG